MTQHCTLFNKVWCLRCTLKPKGLVCRCSQNWLGLKNLFRIWSSFWWRQRCSWRRNQSCPTSELQGWCDQMTAACRCGASSSTRCPKWWSNVVLVRGATYLNERRSGHALKWLPTVMQSWAPWGHLCLWESATSEHWIQCDQMTRLIILWPFSYYKDILPSIIFFAKLVSKFCQIWSQLINLAVE